jgi:hypothetical protein
MYPDYSWANQSADSGDLIIAAASNGVPHPTGYPTYILLAHLFQTLIPFGTLPFKTHLLSALSALAAALLIYKITLPKNPPAIYWPSIFAALTFALSPLTWSQAIITEVYTLNTVFITLIIIQIKSIKTQPHPSLKSYFLLGITFGLGLGNHISLILLAPLILILLYISPQSKIQLRWQTYVAFLLSAGLGSTIYLSLIFRARTFPPINWENPTNLINLWRLLSAQLYHGYLFAFSTKIELFQHILNQVSHLHLQLSAAVCLLSIIGLILLYTKQPWLFYTTLYIALAHTIFTLAYHTHDSWTNLLPVTISIAIWISTAVQCILSNSTKHLSRIFITAVSFLFIVKAIFAFPYVNARLNHQAQDFANTVLYNAPPNAILLAQEDEEIFTLWYYQIIMEQRPDLAIIALGLINEPWYLKNIALQYPQINPEYDPTTPIEVLIQNNPKNPICDIDYQNPNPIFCYQNGITP